MGHWLELTLDQPAPNSDAIGAWIEVRVGDTTMQRELTVGGGHLSGELGTIHVGIGPSSVAEVRVTWPDGTVGPWQRVDADQVITIEREP